MHVRTWLIALICTLLMAGCTTSQKVQPGDGTTDYVENHIYTLKKPIFLVRHSPGYDSLWITDYYLEPEGHRGDDAPTSIAEYQKDGPREWPRVVRIVPAGTRLQFKEMRITKSISFGEMAHPFGVLLDGGPPNPGYVGLGRISKDAGRYINHDLLEE